VSTATATYRAARGRRQLTLTEVAILCGVALIVLLAAIWPALGHTVRSDAPPTSVRVATNQTLWSIASSHRGAGMSTAETVDWIRRVNGLHTSVLREGSVLRVPAPPSETATAWLVR